MVFKQGINAQQAFLLPRDGAAKLSQNLVLESTMSEHSSCQ